MMPSACGEKTVEDALVDPGQPLDIGERYFLVHLVHGAADHAELGDGAVVLDESRIGGAAGGRELRLSPGHLLDGPRHDLAERTRRRHEGFAADMQLQLVAPADRGETLLEPAGEAGAAMGVVEADVEDRPRRRRNDIARRIAHIDARDLEGRGLEMWRASKQRISGDAIQDAN